VSMGISKDRIYLQEARAVRVSNDYFEQLFEWYFVAIAILLVSFALYSIAFNAMSSQLGISLIAFSSLLSVGHFRTFGQSGSQQELKLVEFLETKLADSASEVNIITNNDSDYIQQARAICDRGHQFERICKWCFLSLYTLLFVHELYFWGTSDYRLDFTYAATIHIVGTILSHFRSWNSDQSGSQHELKLIEFLEAKLVEAEVGKKAEN
jgi:hypothetical protein